MAAFYRNTKQSGFDKNWRESDVYTVVPLVDRDRVRWGALPSEIEAARKRRDAEALAAGEAFTNWLSGLKPETPSTDIKIPGEQLHAALNEGSGTNMSGRLNGDSLQLANA